MKNGKLRKFAPVAALLFALGVTLASADDGRMGRHGFGRGMGGGMLRGLARLDLTEEQKADVKRIVESHKTTFEALHGKIRTDSEALDQLADAPSPDPAAVGTAFLKVRADRQALRAERQEVMQEIRAILTPEQREKFDTMREMRKERMRGRMEGRRGA